MWVSLNRHEIIFYNNNNMGKVNKNMALKLGKIMCKNREFHWF